jgi:signal transduction histidine kinase
VIKHNKTFAGHLGFDSNRLVGKSFLDLIDDSAATTYRLARAMCRAAGGFRGNFELGDGSAESKVLDLVIVPARIADRDDFLLTTIDNSSRHRDVERLYKAVDRYEQVLRANDMWTWTWNPLKQTSFLSPKIAESLNIAEDVRHPVKQFIKRMKRSDQRSFRRLAESVVRREKPSFEFICDVESDSSTSRRLRTLGWPAVEGRRTTLCGFIQDVSKTHELERSREALIHDVESLHRINTLGRISTELGHELAQPLDSVNRYAEMLKIKVDRIGPACSPLLDLVDRIITQTKRAAATVIKVREFVRNRRVALTTCRVATVLERAIEIACPSSRRREKMIDNRVADETGTLLGDEIQLIHLFVNIIRNALEIFERRSRGSNEGKITIVGERRSPAGKLAISFVDDAGGFDEAVLERVRVGVGATSRKGHAGMGLVIARSIVEQHQGSLDIYSTPGRGTTVTVVLPIQSRR